MPIQVNLNDLEAPPPAPAPAPQQVPSWAQPSNRTERRCVATNDVTVRRAAALDSEVVGELRAGDHCTVDGRQQISRQGRVVERSRICAPLHGWVSTQRLGPADDVLELDARPPPRSAFYAGQRVSVDDQGGRLACRRGAGWRVDLEDGTTTFVDDDSKLEPAPTPRSHWLDGVLEAIASPAEVFLLGESTHGTREYYALRFELIQSLIELKGVSVVAVEGDAVAAARVDSYVRGTSSDRTAEEALRGFTGGRGTTPWLWRNREVERFVEWLRERNASSAAACGFAGLDLFSARASAQMVVEYLELVDPPASRVAADRYGCFLAVDLRGNRAIERYSRRQRPVTLDLHSGRVRGGVLEGLPRGRARGRARRGPARGCDAGRLRARARGAPGEALRILGPRRRGTALQRGTKRRGRGQRPAVLREAADGAGCHVVRARPAYGTGRAEAAPGPRVVARGAAARSSPGPQQPRRRRAGDGPCINQIVAPRLRHC